MKDRAEIILEEGETVEIYVGEKPYLLTDRLVLEWVSQ